MNDERRTVAFAERTATSAGTTSAAEPKRKRKRTATSRGHFWLLTALVLLVGCALRIVPWSSFDGLGYDESWYRKYLLAIDQHGLSVYPEICAAYLEDGKDEQTIAKVPPMRALFVIAGWAWKRAAFGDAPPADLDAPGGLASDPAHLSLRHVAAFFGCFTLLISWGFARRLLGEVPALATLALVSCSPLLIHMSQQPLVDGVYGACALLALWTLWESMQTEARALWLIAYPVSFALMVLAKENAIFPAVGFAVIMLMGKRWGLGVADRRHWFASICAGLVAIAGLAVAAGGFGPMLDVYLLFIRKVQVLGYAQLTGDGPWSRYLIDLIIFTPATLCFAIGGGFRSLRDDRRALMLLVFVAATYLAMCNVRYGMNLRYTTIWVFPLCALAVVQARAIAVRFDRAPLVLAAIIAVLCAIDLAQYRQFFVKHRLYELPTADLLRAERILK